MVVEITLKLVKRLAKPLNLNYYFYWRSGGGRNATLIIDDTEVEKYKQHYGSAHVIVEELPKGIKFLEHIKQNYIKFDYRVLGNTVEIATHVPGKFIGKKGRIIKLLRKMVGKNIKVAEAYLVHYDFIDQCWRLAKKNSKGEYVISSDDPVVKIDEKDLFETKRNPSYGYAISRGYIAPWKIKLQTLKSKGLYSSYYIVSSRGGEKDVVGKPK